MNECSLISPKITSRGADGAKNIITIIYFLLINEVQNAEYTKLKKKTSLYYFIHQYN